MARTRAANPATVADAIAQLQEMNDGARSELAAGRRGSAGTLAIAGAVRAVDLICDAALGEHSVEPSHGVALDLLASVPGAENAVEDFSLCQTRKSECNYHVSGRGGIASCRAWAGPEDVARAADRGSDAAARCHCRWSMAVSRG